MIELGQPAPEFTLPDQNGREVSLASLRGKPVVLYFYPKDDTSGCTAEACGFRDARDLYRKAGAEVVGVSPDPVKSHAKFVEKHQLNFTLLADEGSVVCGLYGVWKEKSMYGRKYMGVERTTFVIDKAGAIAQIFPEVKVNGHVDAVLAAVQALR